MPKATKISHGLKPFIKKKKSFNEFQRSNYMFASRRLIAHSFASVSLKKTLLRLRNRKRDASLTEETIITRYCQLFGHLYIWVRGKRVVGGWWVEGGTNKHCWGAGEWQNKHRTLVKRSFDIMEKPNATFSTEEIQIYYNHFYTVTEKCHWMPLIAESFFWCFRHLKQFF